MPSAALLSVVLAATLATTSHADTPQRFVELWGNDEDMPAGVDPRSVADCALDEDTHVCPPKRDSTGRAPRLSGARPCGVGVVTMFR